MLLCTDFDGTLRDLNDPHVLATNLQALTIWRRAGNLACLVTGRNYSVIPTILPEWQHYFDYLITDNGGATYDNCQQIIFQQRFPPGIVDGILKVIPDNVLPVYYYAHTYTSDRQRYPTRIPIKLRLWFHSLDQLWSEHHRLDTGLSAIKSLPWPKPGFSPLDGVDLSEYCGFIDIVPQKSGKETSIQRLATKIFPQNKIINLTQPQTTNATRDILTVGDDFNDIAMLATFTGYAIANAPPEVIQAASGRTVRSVSELIFLKISSS